MFSFNIPVAALNQQQTKLEVLGENIANLNTTGYKTKRVSFVDTLGSVSGIVQNTFNQGSLTATGISTDLAIDGDSFFVIKKDDEYIYTRSGSFEISAEGKLVNAYGDTVQGWMTNISTEGVLQGTSSLSDIIIDSNMVISAQSTENVWLSGNLNSSLESLTEVWTANSAYTTRATLTGAAAAYPLTVTAGVNDQFAITVDPEYDSAITAELTLTAGAYATVDDLVTEINARIAETDLNGNVEAVNDGGNLKFRTLDGEEETVLTVNSGTNDVLTDLGFVDGATATSGGYASSDTEMNDLLQIATNLTSGDQFNVTGTAFDGSAISSVFEYGVDGTTLGDLIEALNDAYGAGSNVSLVDGKITVTDLATGNSDTTISITADSGNVGDITVPSFANTTAGYTAEVSTSVVIYDSLGESHTLTINFVKGEEEGEWSWDITCSGDEVISSGGSGKVFFDDSGEFVSFTYDGGVDALTVNPNNGSSELIINIQGGDADGYSGLSQYNSVSTLYGRDQDGRQSGALSSFSIESDGSIVGLFDTGEQMQLAKIALAHFNNPLGLAETSESNYTATDESGIAHIGTAESQGAGINSGYLEGSTVDLAGQFTEMIASQQAYQAASKVITTFDELFDTLNNMKR